MIRIVAYILFLIIVFSCGSSVRNPESVDRLPEIFPDYSEITIPPNIAPMSFVIREPGTEFIVNFSSEDEKSFSVKSGTPEIFIPTKKWKRLLEKNTGKTLEIEIVVKDGNSVWNRFRKIENHISRDSIDPYIAYRRINPGMILWHDMAIVQRSLENFYESDILANQNAENSCIHCHTFQNHDPGKMILHMRMSPSGTLIKTEDRTLWLTTKTHYTLSSFVYPAWHPEGRYIAFSTNRIHQNFFGSGDRINHVRDDASDIVIYDVFENEVFTSPKVASKDFENLPAWSPCGNFLYYIQSPHEHKYLHDSLEKYDLMRIKFDIENKEWGNPEKLISSDSTGMSVSFPQVSPCGKYVVFSMADYGYFNINNTSSNLYIYNTVNNELKELSVNSDKTESFPSWSENGRWISFTSKRFDGMFTLPFFSYIDSNGIAQKPFVIPFENPASYQTRLTNMNRPVFLAGKVEYTQKELLEIAYSSTENVIFDSIHVNIDALAGATMNTADEEDETTSLYKKN